jgi:hypothetical protein
MVASWTLSSQADLTTVVECVDGLTSADALEVKVVKMVATVIMTTVDRLERMTSLSFSGHLVAGAEA